MDKISLHQSDSLLYFWIGAMDRQKNDVPTDIFRQGHKKLLARGRQNPLKLSSQGREKPAKNHPLRLDQRNGWFLAGFSRP